MYPLLGIPKHFLITSVTLCYVLLMNMKFSLKVSLYDSWDLGNLNWTPA